MTAAEPVHASIYWVKASKHWALDEVRVIGDTFLTSRIGEYAPAPAADRTRLTTISAQPLIRVLGPDYVGFPAADFADPQHMNPQGATAYTADLAGLLKSSGVFD